MTGLCYNGHYLSTATNNRISLTKNKSEFMPILNPDKCYTQQKQRLPITMPEVFPTHWLADFYERLAVQLNLDDKTKLEVLDHQTNTTLLLTSKKCFFRELDRHVGTQSSFTYKSQLLESLGTVYFIFIHPSTSDEQRHMIASRIAEDVRECSPGFTNRVNFLITLFNMPQNIDELIAQVRFKLVDRIAGIIAAQNPQGIHVHNRVIEVARGAGFGIWPINTGDIFSHAGSHHLSDEAIIERVGTGFANHFQLFSLVNALCAELEILIAKVGYQGKRGLENDYQQEEYAKFNECINCFIPIAIENLLEIDPSGKVTNINWQHVKRAWLKKLREEGYVSLSQEEATLLDGLLHETMPLDATTLSTLIPHGYELVQCLEFFSEWSIEQKANIVHTYLTNKSPDEQKEVLAILHNEAPQLTIELKKEQRLQAIYFAIAIAEKEVAAVRTYVEQGEDINAALLLLFSQAHKSDTLYWLHDNPHLLQKMTVSSLNTVIGQGKYQGKTIAETLVSTKKGRQLSWENEALQSLLSQTTMAHTLADAMRQAQTEINTVPTREGFFKKSSPLAMQLVQYIVYGDLAKSDALLQGNPSLLETLLTEKVTVIDYSRRKVKQKTAFQTALCTMDDELCAMLAHYMPKDELIRQYHEIFPKKHETYSQEQTPFDFSQIVETISQSSDADVEKALSLELPNDTALWRSLEQFRSDFTNRSSQEAVFNPQHLLQAFDLYDSQFNQWSWNQADLFWRQVIGYVQRFLPANIAMDFAQGLYNRVENKENSVRSFKFQYGGGSIFPLAFDSFSGLGYEFAVVAGPAPRGWRAGWSGWPFQNLCRAKTAVLGELYSQRLPAVAV